MFNFIDAMFNEEELLLILIATTAMTAAVVAYFWPRVPGKLSRHRERAARLRESFEIEPMIQALEAKLRKHLEAVESGIAQTGSAISLLRHEAGDAEKHAGRLAIQVGSVGNKFGSVNAGVDSEISSLKQLHDLGRENAILVDGNTLKIAQIEHEVHRLYREAHQIELRRIDEKIKSGLTRVHRNARQIEKIENEVLVLLRQPDQEYHDHFQNGDYGESRSRAIAELESADRKIENLMDETIQMETGYFGHHARPGNGMPTQEYEEHHRKLIDTAQHIFRDIKKYLMRTSVHDMEIEAEKVDRSRGELFANPANTEAARAYHQQVKDYFIKLKEAITESLHELSELPKPRRFLSSSSHIL